MHLSQLRSRLLIHESRASPPNYRAKTFVIAISHEVRRDWRRGDNTASLDQSV